VTTKHEQIREQLAQVVAVIRPYAHGVGPFPDLADVKSAINLAKMLLDKAGELARTNGTP
jgi:hypothetical protein